MEIFDEVIKLTPAIVDRPWGREEWLISARGESPSLVNAHGGLVGLHGFLGHCGLQVMGPRWEYDPYFPVLGKNLICDEKLSVQVHPSVAAAKKYGGEPKEEFWFVTGHEDGASVLAGFEDFTTQEGFVAAVKSGNPEMFLHELPCYRGASLFIPSGRVHAIGGGVRIFEMQQSSDTTYRVWDYNRPGLDGHLRELHIEQALESMDFRDVEPSFFNSNQLKNGEILAACRSFRVRRFDMGPYQMCNLGDANQPQIVYVVSGSIMCTPGVNFLESGEAALVPYDMDLTIEAEEKGATVLVTDNFFKNQ